MTPDHLYVLRLRLPSTNLVLHHGIIYVSYASFYTHSLEIQPDRSGIVGNFWKVRGFEQILDKQQEFVLFNQKLSGIE